MADENKIVDEIQSTLADLRKKNDEIEAEQKRQGSADVVSRDELGKIETAIASLDEKHDKLILAQKRAERFQEVGGEQVDVEAKAQEFADRNARQRGMNSAPTYTAADLAEYKRAFGRYIRNEEVVLGADERKALSSGSNPDGGYTIHPDLSGRIVKKAYETSIMRAYASVVTTGSNEYQGIYDNDEAGAEWVGETQARSDTTTPKLGAYSIPLHELSALPKATQRMLDDSDMDMEAWLADKVATRFARKENTAFVNGDGSAKPRGFLTYADGTDLTNSVERFKTGVDGGFAAAPNGGDVLIDMVGGLKAEYIGGASWFMNRSSITKARKLKDSDGAYLWQQSLAAGRPSTLLGYDVAPAFSDMPDFGTGSLPIAFGDMRQAYTIVDRLGLRMLRDPLTNKPYVLFYTTKRVGGDLVNGEALKFLEASA